MKIVQSSDDTRKRTYLGDIMRAVLSWVELGPMPVDVGCPDVVRMVAGVVLGSGRVPGEGWPLFGVLADVESGALVGVGPIIQHH